MSNAPLRVLLTISDLRGGGAEREFSLLVKHLSRERVEPELCFWRSELAWDHPPDIPVHMLEKTRPWHLPKVVRAMARLVDERRPDVIFSQLHYVNMVTGTALARTRHQPAWVCRQVNDPRREMRGLFATWARYALRRADLAVGCCDGVSRAMASHLRLEARGVKTLRNLVDLAAIEERSREPLPFSPSYTLDDSIPRRTKRCSSRRSAACAVPPSFGCSVRGPWRRSCAPSLFASA